MNPPSFTARTPEDLIACVPLALGFVPQDSAVMLSLPPGPGMHARVDLVGTSPAAVAAMCQALVPPAVRNGVGQVVLVVFGDLDDAASAGAALLDAFTLGGVQVLALLVADGSRWRSLLPGPWSGESRPYDVLSHPFVTEAVVEGRVVLRSRDELAGTIATDHAAVEQVDQALAAVGPARPGWVRTTIERHLAAGTRPNVEEVARLLLAVQDAPSRLAAWGWVAREDARAHVDLWAEVVRSTPARWLTAPAALLAFASWLAGDGALAWCALDRARAAGRPCPLTDLVEALLDGAHSPESWSPPFPGAGRGAPGGTKHVGPGDHHSAGPRARR